MIKAFSAIAIAAFAATALTVLPGFAPEVEASVPAALTKSDRLDIRATAGCVEAVWPDIPAACLRHAETGAPVQEARIRSR
jgi:hypothetical protein